MAASDMRSGTSAKHYSRVAVSLLAFLYIATVNAAVEPAAAFSQPPIFQ